MNAGPARPIPRVRPVPAPDEHHDPIDTSPADDSTEPDYTLTA